MNVSFESEIKKENYITLKEGYLTVRFEEKSLINTLHKIVKTPHFCEDDKLIPQHEVDFDTAEKLCHLCILKKYSDPFVGPCYYEADNKAKNLYNQLEEVVRKNTNLLNGSFENGKNSDLDDLEFDIEM